MSEWSWRPALGSTHSSQYDEEDQSLEWGEKIHRARSGIVIYDTHITPVNFLKYRLVQIYYPITFRNSFLQLFPKISNYIPVAKLLPSPGGTVTVQMHWMALGSSARTAADGEGGTTLLVWASFGHTSTRPRLFLAFPVSVLVFYSLEHIPYVLSPEHHQWA